MSIDVDNNTLLKIGNAVDDEANGQPSMEERARTAGDPPPPSSAPRTAAPTTTQEHASENAHDDDVYMNDASGSSRGKGEKGAEAHRRSGRGRGGSR